MTILVDLHRSDLAEVTIAPSLLRRILFGARAETRFAVRVLVVTGGWGWSWDDTGRRIHDESVLAAIAKAEREARRPIVRHAVEPPS